MKKNKYNINDEFWYMYNKKIRNGKVILISLDNIGESVYYGFNADYLNEYEKMLLGGVAFIEESELFRTKKELIKHLEDESRN